jgi:hypothetical protein
MIHRSGHEHIRNYDKSQVFDAGVQKINWPSHSPGLELIPNDDRLELGSALHIGLKLSRFAIHITGEVTVCNPSGVVIEGADDKAKARIRFLLNDNYEIGGTDIDYALEVAGKKFYVRTAEPLVKTYLDATVPQFTSDYISNISRYLDTHNSAR